jgi:protein O-mannosyl-transferase
VEAVAWISEQKSTLSGVFYLAAALAYLKFDDSRKRSHYLAALALFVAALLSKTVTAVLPGVLLIALWWRKGRFEWKPLAPFFGLGAVAGLFTVYIERTLIGARGAEFALTPLDRIELAGRALCFYAAKIVVPVNLTFFYPRWRLEPADLLYAAAVVAVCLLLRHRRSPLAALLIFAGTLFPALGFFNVYPFRYSYVADHFAYLACAAMVFLIPPRREFLVVAAIFFALTYRQSADYRSEATLYRATLVRNPDAFLAHTNLANLLLADGHRDEALDHLHAALHIDPDFPEAHLTLGNVLVDEPGRLADAIREYETAARLAPNSDRAHTNLGNAFLRAGRLDDAVVQLQQAIRLYPGNAEAHNDLGNAYSQLPNRLPDAIAEYRAALGFAPDFAEAHNNLGRALAQSGQLPDALAQFELAIRLKPDYWSAHNNLGNALSLIPGRLADAIAEYRYALRVRPDSPISHNNLGYALSKQPGSLPEAIAEYREALRLNPNYTDARLNLDAALRGK